MFQEVTKGERRLWCMSVDVHVSRLHFRVIWHEVSGFLELALNGLVNGAIGFGRPDLRCI